MKCDRCQGVMCEEPIVVRGGLVKIKNMTAWHCMHCGRTEYRCISADQDIVPCTKDYSYPAAGSNYRRRTTKFREEWPG